MEGFRGARKKRAYFEGWYCKQQNGSDTVAMIPALHIDGSGRRSASIQVITGDDAFFCEFPPEAFQAERNRFHVRIGDSVFSSQGCSLDCRTNSGEVTGFVRYEGMIRPESDIMGPFRWAPFLQCRHSVLSLRHRVDGRLSVNGKSYVFEDGSGYIEGDRGHSFPKRYLWTQHSWDGNSVMLSVADVPFGGFSFTGCIGSILFNDKEYRIATYCGAKLLHVSPVSATVRQKDLLFRARLMDSGGHRLRAPSAGGMTRTICENPACRVEYKLLQGGAVLFAFESGQASFESKWRT